MPRNGASSPLRSVKARCLRKSDLVREKSMKRVANLYICVLILFTFVMSGWGQKAGLSTRATGNPNEVTVADFEARVRKYTERREALESELPQLSKQATAEEIAEHKAALLKKVLAARATAKRGDVFTQDAERMIRSIIASHYKGRDRLELRKELAEAENKMVRIKVNGIYPESAELLEMPPTLLLALPQLPKQVRYRFVGRSLLLVDRESHMIVDHMANALR